MARPMTVDALIFRKPQFFTTDFPGTVAYYKNKLGFESLGTWQDPPVYAIVARDQLLDQPATRRGKQIALYAACSTHLHGSV